MRCALPDLTDGAILGAELVCGIMLKDERTPSPWKLFNGSDAREASAKRETATGRVGLSGRR
jgi:hypothetical protein